MLEAGPGGTFKVLHKCMCMERQKSGVVQHQAPMHDREKKEEKAISVQEHHISW